MTSMCLCERRRRAEALRENHIHLPNWASPAQRQRTSWIPLIWLSREEADEGDP